MATPPESPIEEVPFELEQARPPKPIPVALDELCRQTKFTKQEIRVMYRGFKTECPDGTVNEDGFKDIYTKFFPHGNTSVYAHLTFKAFDMKNSGSITFGDLLVVLNSLLKGSVYERLRWTFKLYDLDRDGKITKSELSEVILSVHELMGRKPNQQEEDRKAKEQQPSRNTRCNCFCIWTLWYCHSKPIGNDSDYGTELKELTYRHAPEAQVMANSFAVQFASMYLLVQFTVCHIWCHIFVVAL